MEYPVQVAFCPLLFAHNGGQFSENGKPIFSGEDIRGSCDEGYDCGDCLIMQAWLDQLQTEGWKYGWECLMCLSTTKDTPRQLPGHFQEGRSEIQEGEDRPSVPGCTGCGWESSFLQLVLRRTK